MKVHGRGGTKGHLRLEVNASAWRRKRNKKRLLRKNSKRKRKRTKKLVRLIKIVTRPEVLEAWARKEQLIARKQLRERRIRPFTFLCKLLAIESLLTKKAPGREVKIGKKRYTLARKASLERTQERDIWERLNDIGKNKAEIRKEVRKQVRNLRKTL